jgi:hypothetical protein
VVEGAGVDLQDDAVGRHRQQVQAQQQRRGDGQVRRVARGDEVEWTSVKASSSALALERADCAWPP